MAATSTAYLTATAKFAKANSDSSFSEIRVCSIARLLANSSADSGDGYFNESDSEEAKKQKIKSLFKLDGFGMIQQGGGGAGFIGFVLKGSSNAAFHKSSRFSGILPPKGVSGGDSKYELLNDAGLNVKGLISAYDKSQNYSSDTEHNSISFPVLTFKSSFYNPTTAHGLAWRKVGDSGWNYASKGSLPARSSQTYSPFSIDVDYTDTLYIEAPYTYDVAPYIENEEGLIRLDGASGTGETFVNKTVQALAYPRSYNFGATLNAAYMGTDVRTLYLTRRKIVVGMRTLLDATGGNLNTPEDGFYLNMTADVNGYRQYYLMSGGNISEIGSYDATAMIQYHLPYMYLASDLQAAFNGADALNFTKDYTGRTRYSRENGGEWYMYDDVSNQYGVFLLEVIGDIPHTFENSTLYWIATNNLNKIIDYSVPNNDLDAFIQTNGTIIN